MKTCSACGFKGRWLTHFCPGPPGHGITDLGNGYISVETFPLYPAQVVDLSEAKERDFKISTDTQAAKGDGLQNH